MVYRKKKYARRRNRRYRRKYYRKGRRGGLTGKIKAVIGKMAETKFARLTAENQQLYHNVGLSTGPVVFSHLLRTDKGTNQNSRVGDTVYGKYLKLKLWISSKSDRPNVMYRIMVIQCPPDQALTTNPTDLFRAYNNNKMVDYINTDKYGIVYQKYIRIESDSSVESGAALHEVSKIVNVYVPLNRKVTYQADLDGTATVCKLMRNNLSLVIIPYDAFGTLTTDNIASYACCGLFCFKDMQLKYSVQIIFKTQ